MIDSLSELASGFRFTITGCKMEVTVGGASLAVTPIDSNGFCIRFDSPVSLDVGENAIYKIIDMDSGEEAEGLSIKIVTVDTLAADKHRIGAIYND